jgi:hypothetical protein
MSKNKVTKSPGASVIDGVVAGIIGGQPLQPMSENSSIVAGSTVIGIAAVCLMIITVFSVRFRNGHRQAYLRHLEELSEVSDLSLGEKEQTAPLSNSTRKLLRNTMCDNVHPLLVKCAETENYNDLCIHGMRSTGHCRSSGKTDCFGLQIFLQNTRYRGTISFCVMYANHAMNLGEPVIEEINSFEYL